MAQFDPASAEQALQARLDSLDKDTQRCFLPIKDGPGPAFFPAVLYAFATIDYLSSCWAGWNDSKLVSGKSQTDRIADFLERYCRYGKKECHIAVHMWRHKLMHTGEPRIIRNVATDETYYWEINASGQTHMKLVPINEPRQFRFQINPNTLVEDLKNSVLGPDGYLDELRQSPHLQEKIMEFFQETERYMISIKL